MNARKRLAYWRNYHRYVLNQENKFTPIIQRALLQQIKAVIDSMRRQGVENTINELSILVTATPIQEALIKLWYAIFPPYATAITRDLENEYAVELGLKKFFDTPNKYWLQIINDYILASVPGQVRDITEYTRTWIQMQIRKGLEQQMSIDEIVQLIITSDISASRARVIARTNITTVTNGAGKAAARETKLLLRKTWISAQDNRTRRIPRDRYDHLNMDGVTVNMDEMFNVNGDMIDYPGDPRGAAANIIQCRCTTAYEAVRDRNGRIIRNEFTSVMGPRTTGGAQQIITI